MCRVIQCKNISFKYQNDSFALKDIDFSIKKGELVSVVGPNGSGKTTLSKLLIGYLSPNKGKIFINGKPVDSYSSLARSRCISFVPQFKNTYYDGKLVDFVLLGAYSRNDEIKTIKEECLSILEYLGLLEKKDFPVGSLSAGELQKAVLAQTLIQNAPIIILDEPTAHLDIYWQKSVIEKIIKLAGKRNYTVISILHDINIAVSLFKKIICMKDGKIAYNGETQTGQIKQQIEKTFDIQLTSYSNNKKNIFWYG